MVTGPLLGTKTSTRHLALAHHEEAVRRFALAEDELARLER